MLRRLTSLVVLLAVALCGGSVGRVLHEMQVEAAEARLSVSSFNPSSDRDDAPRHAPRHDHERCAQCQLLGAPGIDRLAGEMSLIGGVRPPQEAFVRVEVLPYRTTIDDCVDARGPPLNPLV